MSRLAAILISILFVASYCSAIELTPADAPVKLDFYGVILANTFWNSAGLFASDVPLWVVSGTDVRAEDEEFGMTARQSRFGFRFKGPDVKSAKLTALLEADFFGGFPASGQAPSFANPRLRLGWMKLEWTSISFLAGQDWIILAPLNPTTLSHFAVVGLATSGNLWLRYPQLRFDFQKQVYAGKLGVTAGLIRPVSGSDAPTGGTLVDIAGAGERSGVPFFQGRLFYSRPSGQKTTAVGVSAHYGKEEYKLGAALREEEIDTWAIAGDFQIPIGSTFSVQGEIFTGANLDSFQGGINQGFRLTGATFSDATAIEEIETKGGWVQFSVTPPSILEWNFHFAYGLEDPDEATLSRGQRSKNSTWMASVFYKPTKYFQVAGEYSFLETEYFQGVENDASVFNLAFAFSF